jgi:hypothetical protein
MKPRWLLLAVSLICLLVLAPATALAVAMYDLGGQVWYDTNQNGTQDPGEPGVSGVDVELFANSDCSGSGVDNDTTDANIAWSSPISRWAGLSRRRTRGLMALTPMSTPRLAR